MKKILALLLASAMATTLLTGCGGSTSTTTTAAATTAAVATTAASAADTTKTAADTTAAGKTSLNVGVLVWKYSDTYGSSVRAAIEKYAASIGAEKGITVNLNMVDGNDDQAIQNDQASTLLQKDLDLLVVNLCEVTAGQPIVDLAKAAGVPVLFYNKEPSESSVVTGANSIFIGTKAEQAGEMQGDILAQLVKADPKIDTNGDGTIQYLMFKGDPDNIEAIARSKSSVSQAIKDGLKLEQVNGEDLVCNWDTAKAQEAMAAVWAKYDVAIEAIFCNNDDMGLGVIAALNEVGYNTGVAGDKVIPVIGVDATDAAAEAIKNGKLQGTVKQDGDAMGKAIIELAINGAQGKAWLDGTSYKMADDGYSIRIPYSPVTQ